MTVFGNSWFYKLKVLVLLWLLPRNSHICVSPMGHSSFESLLHLERAKKKAKESNQDWNPQSFSNLISEVTLHHFFHILFIRNELRGPDHKNRWGLHQGIYSSSHCSLGTMLHAVYYKQIYQFCIWRVLSSSKQI